MMQSIAPRMTEREMNAVAEYIQALGRQTMIQNFKKTKAHLILASTLFFTAAFADDHMIYEEGRHYKSLGLAEKVVAEDNRVEVLEVFAYSCNHCFNFEPYLDQFDRSKACLLYTSPSPRDS